MSKVEVKSGKSGSAGTVHRNLVWPAGFGGLCSFRLVVNLFQTSTDVHPILGPEPGWVSMIRVSGVRATREHARVRVAAGCLPAECPARSTASSLACWAGLCCCL